jgi:hypothetical protein
MLFPLETLGCDMHSLLDVIKGFRRVKDCKDNPPIVPADPRDELTVFGKIENFAPGSLSANASGAISLLAKFLLLESFFSSIFLENILCINI